MVLSLSTAASGGHITALQSAVIKLSLIKLSLMTNLTPLPLNWTKCPSSDQWLSGTYWTKRD